MGEKQRIRSKHARQQIRRDTERNYNRTGDPPSTLLEIQSPDREKACYQAFLQATSYAEGTERVVGDMPRLLKPSTRHAAQVLFKRHVAGFRTGSHGVTNAIVEMLEGQRLPHPSMELASVLAATYVGSKNWLKSTFRV